MSWCDALSESPKFSAPRSGGRSRSSVCPVVSPGGSERLLSSRPNASAPGAFGIQSTGLFSHPTESPLIAIMRGRISRPSQRQDECRKRNDEGGAGQAAATPGSWSCDVPLLGPVHSQYTGRPLRHSITVPRNDADRRRSRRNADVRSPVHTANRRCPAGTSDIFRRFSRRTPSATTSSFSTRNAARSSNTRRHECESLESPWQDHA